MTFQPDPGYEWVDPDALFKEARWTPGMEHRDHSNVSASDIQDMWRPNPGFQWGGTVQADNVTTDYSPSFDDGKLIVHWQPGVTHPAFPHIFAYQKIGQWIPEKGYVLVKEGDLSVVWSPGQRDPDRNHYISAATEGEWELEPGYKLVNGWFGSTYAAWSSGMAHPRQRCLVSASQEGTWTAVAGYHVEQTADNHWKIVGDSKKTDWGGVALGVITALWGYSSSGPQQGDDGMTKHVWRPIAKEVGDAGVKTAVDSWQKNNSGSCAGVVLDDSWSRPPAN